MLDSTQASQGGGFCDSDLDDLKNLFSKIEDENKKTWSLLKEIQDVMGAMKAMARG